MAKEMEFNDLDLFLMSDTFWVTIGYLFIGFGIYVLLNPNSLFN